MSNVDEFNTVANLVDFDPIYIVAQCDGGVGPIHAYNTLSDLKEHLENVDFYTEDVQVYYGSCMPATAIPENPGSIEMYLIVENDESDGYVLGLDYDYGEEDSVTDTIAAVVDTTLEQGDDVAISMDNLFVLYGAEMPIRITVADDDVDDELMERCKQMKTKAEELGSCIEA